jgi:hypothetical protein
MLTMKRLFLLVMCAGALAGAAELAGVHSVYVFPMSHGLDQYLANRLTNEHVFRVVTDPKLADAVFSDRVGDALRDQLESVSPTPKPEEPKKAADDKKAKDIPDDNPGRMLAEGAKLDNPALRSSFGRAKGTLFLVDAKSRQVVWSVYMLPKDSSSKQLDRTASDIVNRLKQDLK